jgi:hypothetical protein
VYDNIHLYFQLPAGDDEAFTRMTMSSAFVHGTPGFDNFQCLRIAYRGLRIDYWSSQRRGRIRGSLHTFALGHNRGTFTAAMVASACEELAQVVGVPGTLLRVVRLEIGVNLATPTSPYAFLTSLSHHKRKPFYPTEPPRNCSQPLLFVATYQDYRVKFYDKAKYARSKGEIPKVDGYLLRFEVAFSRSRPLLKLIQRQHLTLSDLPAPELLTVFASHLQKHWQLSKRKTPKIFEGLPIQDAILLHASDVLEIWRSARKSTPTRTLRHYKRRSEKLWEASQQRTPPHPYEELFLQRLVDLLPVAVS